MAKKKTGFDTTALLKYAADLEAAGDSAALKRAVEAGMKSTKQKTNEQVRAAMQPGNLPARGRYSTGKTLQQLNTDMDVQWDGNTAILPLGFNLRDGGMVSIFLMYGTPKHGPAPGLREALKENPRKISRKEMESACKKILERLGK